MQTVYGIQDAGKIVYVGMTGSTLKVRWSNGSKYREYLPLSLDAYPVELERVSTRAEARQAERAWIAKLSPGLNRNSCKGLIHPDEGMEAELVPLA